MAAQARATAKAKPAPKARAKATAKKAAPKGKAGRPKGALNNNKRGMMARLRREFPNYHPVIEMARLANDKSQDDKIRFDANKEVAKYVVPQLKSVEHKTDGDGAMVPAFMMYLPK